MAVDRWFFGGGAEHTPESARRALYASTSGAEGVGARNDLKVLPLAVPGAGVRVLIGSALIRSRYVGGETQTYMGTVYEQETVSTTPTGSGQTRTDLVVMRVEDPYAAGSPYSPPSEPERATAPYIHIRVISGVPAGTKRLQDVPGYQNDTAIALARIVFPASTGTVTSAMIVDLREVAQPRTLTEVRAYQATGVSDPEYIESSSAETWPHFAEAAGVLSVDVPEWARRMKIVMTVSGYKFSDGSSTHGRFWCQVGATSNPDAVTTQHSVWAADRPGPIRVSDVKPVPVSMRGTTQKFFPRARRDGGTSANGPAADWATNVDFTVTFEE